MASPRKTFTDSWPFKSSGKKADKNDGSESKRSDATSFSANLEDSRTEARTKPRYGRINLRRKKHVPPAALTNPGTSEQSKDVRSRSKQEDKSDRPGIADPSSKSVRQLFSMADSWSSDSVISRSDSCTCCHTKQACPVHGGRWFFGNE